ncbi:hypothetical protein SNEBB_007646, partial [Seison nebaliae]
NSDLVKLTATNRQIENSFVDQKVEMKRKSKVKKSKDENLEIDRETTLDSFDKKVCKYLFKHSPPKNGMLSGMNIKYFFANRIVNALWNSPWCANVDENNCKWKTRENIVEFLNNLMIRGAFHRAQKIYKEDLVKEKEVKKKKKNEIDGKIETEKTEVKKDKKRKFKLIMHPDQFFVDDNEIYVWIYEPTTWKSLFIGTGLLFGAILLCLFPLWPPEIRTGVYYLTLCLAVFVAFLFFLIILKLFLFAAIWICTVGGIHFWLLPNLTEDVGFFASFWPLYTVKTMGKVKETNNKTEDQSKEEDETKEVIEQSVFDDGLRKRMPRKDDEDYNDGDVNVDGDQDLSEDELTKDANKNCEIDTLANDGDNKEETDENIDEKEKDVTEEKINENEQEEDDLKEYDLMTKSELNGGNE